MVKKKLNVPERLLLMGVLPQEGNFVTLKTIRDTMDNVGFKEEEIKLYDIKTENQLTKWNPKGLDLKEFEFGEKSTDLIVGALEKLDKENKLTQQHFSLFEKFVKGDGK